MVILTYLIRDCFAGGEPLLKKILVGFFHLQVTFCASDWTNEHNLPNKGRELLPIASPWPQTEEENKSLRWPMEEHNQFPRKI